MCAAEDETDIQAVKVARAEQKAELAEFDETQPWDEVKTDQDMKKETDDPSSNVEVELALLEKDVSTNLISAFWTSATAWHFASLHHYI